MNMNRGSNVPAPCDKDPRRSFYQTVSALRRRTAVRWTAALIAVVVLVATPQIAFAAPKFTAVAPVASLNTVYVKVGNTIKITGRNLPKGDKVKSYKSSKKKVATINSKGKLKALKVGATTITITTKKGKKDTIKVKVVKKDRPAKKITLPKTKKLGVKQVARLSVKVSPGGCTSTIKWSSSDEEIATVNAGGYITPRSPGKVKITATTSNGKKAVCKLTVNELFRAAAVTVTPAEAAVNLYDKFGLAAALVPEDPNVPSNDIIEWSSADERIATVSGGGTVTAVGVGTVKITALAIGSGVKSSATITVLDLKGDVRITPGVRYKPKFTFEDGSKPLTYSSSNDAIATVDAEGYVQASLRDPATGHANVGTVMITAFSDTGEVATLNVAVSDEPTIVDLSKHQGDIDWSLASQAIDLAILRVTYGPDSSYEQKYLSYSQSCLDYGVPFGVYSFALYKTKAAAEKEATALYKRATLDGRAPLFFIVDIEESYIKSSHTEAYLAKLRELAEADGIARLKVGVYVGHHLYEKLDLYLDTDTEDPVTPDFVWIPRYSVPNSGGIAAGAKRPDYPCDLWQYSSGAHLPGIKGNVDVNTLYDAAGAPLTERDYFSFEWLIAGPDA